MRIFVSENGLKRQVDKMSVAQIKQASAVMDCIGRMIPQEGVDYDVELTFKGSYDPTVSMAIVSHTDKGEWWKKYVIEMIKKYPPSVKNPDPSIPEDTDSSSDQEDSHA